MEHLPRGAVSRVARHHKVACGYVTKVKVGERENIKILQALIAEAEKSKKQKEKLEKRIAAL
jgi:hypothetical protein